MWVTNHTADTLGEINAASGTLEDTIDAGETEETIAGFNQPFCVSSDGTHVWVTNAASNTVWMINASTRTVERAIKVGEYPDGVSSDGTHVWVANGNSNTVSEISIPAGS